jgi:hypothetical protein
MSFIDYKAATSISQASLGTTKCFKESEKIDFTTGSVAVELIDSGVSHSTTKTSLFTS